MSAIPGISNNMQIHTISKLFISDYDKLHNELDEIFRHSQIIGVTWLYHEDASAVVIVTPCVGPDGLQKELQDRGGSRGERDGGEDPRLNEVIC
jgi:hypothetical protein